LKIFKDKIIKNMDLNLLQCHVFSCLVFFFCCWENNKNDKKETKRKKDLNNKNYGSDIKCQVVHQI